jgi:hypothetical protein
MKIISKLYDEYHSSREIYYYQYTVLPRGIILSYISAENLLINRRKRKKNG